MKAWIVVPIFNEAPTIAAVVAGARRHAPVLVVDDGSSDDGADCARAAGAEVIRHPRRLGKGQALRTGLAAAAQRAASHVVTLDGDGQHAPADVPALLARAAGTPHAIVLGSRLGQGPTTLPADRANAIRLAGFFVDWASGLRLADTQTGFRVYPLALFDRIRPRRGGFVFETEVLVLAAAAGVPVMEVPVTVVPRAGRCSRFRPLGDGVAIGAYLAARTLERWFGEVRAAAAAGGAIFAHDRQRLRHAEMVQADAACEDSLSSAAGRAIAQPRTSARLRGWWAHPRRRRAMAAAGATVLAPLVLPLVLAQSLRFVPAGLTSLVRRLYGDRPDPAPTGSSQLEERGTAVAPWP